MPRTNRVCLQLESRVKERRLGTALLMGDRSLRMGAG